MKKDGHVIGNHTYTHIDLAKTGYNEAKKEIEDTNNAIKEITGEKPKFLRPPYGDWNEKLLLFFRFAGIHGDLKLCLQLRYAQHMIRMSMGQKNSFQIQSLVHGPSKHRLRPIRRIDDDGLLRGFIYDKIAVGLYLTKHHTFYFHLILQRFISRWRAPRP